MRFAPALALAGAVAVVATAAYGRGAAQRVPQGFHPETAAAVGVRDYWVIGDYRCAAGRCLALVRSSDAGKRFTRAGLPPLSAQGNVPSLVFVSSRVGYLVTPGGRLYVTHDGGTGWAPTGLGHVREVAAGGGDVYALGRNDLERASSGGSSWHAVSLPVRYRFLVSVAARGGRVWLMGSTRHIRAGDVALRSVDRGTTFKRGHAPCIPGLAGALVPASRNVVWAVCPTGMMAGLSLSTNGGRTFPATRSFHDPGGTHLPALTNGAAIFPSSGDAALLYRGAQGPLLRTADLGRHWAFLKSTHRFAQVLWLQFATSRVGAAVSTTRVHPDQASFWRTTDGGASWRPVPIR